MIPRTASTTTRWGAIALAVLAPACLGCAADAPHSPAEVFVLGSLGALHGREESFSYEDLDEAIRGIDPDVILLEVTGDELAGRARGKPEYARVVWSLLEEPDAPMAYAMEAEPALYDEIVSEGADILTEFAESRPAANAALQAWTEATTEALLAHWNRPSATQDETTDQMARARLALRSGLIPESRRLQERWDSAMVAAVQQAIRENPGSRILILGTFRNRFMFEDALREMLGTRVVDVSAWLRRAGTVSER